MKLMQALVAVAAVLAVAATVARAADDGIDGWATNQPINYLATTIMGATGDGASADAWGEQQSEPPDMFGFQGKFRVYRGRGVNGRIALKPWWKGDAPTEDVVLIIQYKDVPVPPSTQPEVASTQPASIDSQVIVSSYNGLGGDGGFNYVGQFGPSKNGQWKSGLVFVPKELICRHPTMGYAVQFKCPQVFALAQVDAVKANEELKQRAIAEGRASRAAAIEAIKKSPEWKENPWRESVQLGEVSEEQQAKGFILFARNWTQDVFHGTVPTPAEREAKKLAAYSSPGEFEAVQVAAHALADVTLTATVSDLAGPGGVLKSGQDVAINAVECTSLRAGGSSAAKVWQVKPAWLRDNLPCPVKAGTSQAWRVTIHVPADAKPGDYKGTFTLTSATGAKAELPVEYRVLPFALDRADHVGRGAYISSLLGEEYIQDLAEHGVNCASGWTSGLGIEPKLVDGKCVCQVPPATDTYFRNLRKHGINRFAFFGGGDPSYQNPAHVANATGAKVGSPEFAKYYGEYWVDLRRQEQANGWPAMICVPFDEPVKTAEKTANYLACYDAVKKASPLTQVMCVFMSNRGAAKELGRQADIWSCNGAFAENQQEKAALAKDGINRLFFTYTMCTVGSRPGATRFNAGLLPFKYGADATYFWAYVWYTDDPFNDLDGRVADWSPVARDVDGKLYRTVGYEGWRQGVNDRRYVETCLRLAREAGRKDILEKVAQLQAKIESGKESQTSIQTQGLDEFYFTMSGTSAPDAFRAQVVAWILELAGKK